MGLLRKNNKIIVKIIFINVGGRKEKTTFLLVFSTYIPMFLLKFPSIEIVGCRIKFCIQRVPTLHTFNGPRHPPKQEIYFYIQRRPTLHTFDGPHYPKSKKYLKNVMMMMMSSSRFFRYFLFLG